MAINAFAAAVRRGRSTCRTAPAVAGTRPRNTRTMDHTAPTMITSAATPDPTAAKTRGATPNSSLPLGRRCPPRSLDDAGALNTTPTAAPERPINHARVMLPTRWPSNRYTVPRASHGTFNTAPARKNTRNDARLQPRASAHHKAIEPRAKSNNETVQAPSWGRRRRNHRSNVKVANARATNVVAAARAAFNVTQPRIGRRRHRKAPAVVGAVTNDRSFTHGTARRNFVNMITRT